jgi:hypothetical protein
VLNEPALLKHLAEAGRQLVLERFTLERMLDDIEAFLAKQLGRTAGD